MTHLLAPVAGGRAHWRYATPVRTAPLTARQAAVHAAALEFSRVHGYPPTVRDVAAATGLSPTGAYHQMVRLTEAGLLGTGGCGHA